MSIEVTAAEVAPSCPERDDLPRVLTDAELVELVRLTGGETLEYLAARYRLNVPDDRKRVAAHLILLTDHDRPPPEAWEKVRRAGLPFSPSNVASMIDRWVHREGIAESVSKRLDHVVSGKPSTGKPPAHLDVPANHVGAKPDSRSGRPGPAASAADSEGLKTHAAEVLEVKSRRPGPESKARPKEPSKRAFDAYRAVVTARQKQQVVAKRLGVSQGHVSRLVKGARLWIKAVGMLEQGPTKR